jgi:hypothetical protein
MSLPPPSARTCTLVLNPPRLRPSASPSWPLFLPPPRADVPAPWSHQRNELPRGDGLWRELWCRQAIEKLFCEDLDNGAATRASEPRHRPLGQAFEMAWRDELPLRLPLRLFRVQRAIEVASLAVVFLLS